MKVYLDDQSPHLRLVINCPIYECMSKFRVSRLHFLFGLSDYWISRSFCQV